MRSTQDHLTSVAFSYDNLNQRLNNKDSNNRYKKGNSKSSNNKGGEDQSKKIKGLIEKYFTEKVNEKSSSRGHHSMDMIGGRDGHSYDFYKQFTGGIKAKKFNEYDSDDDGECSSNY